MISYFKNHYKILILIAIIIIGYFQISFFIYPLKFGAITFHYPWRFSIVEAIRQGEIPFWYWTQHMGVPIYADPQSGAWYPLVWLFSLFGSYSLYSFHAEFLIHILIAGLGMNYLSRVLKISKFSSFFISIAWVFSGIFSDNVLTSWTISMAWIPIIAGTIIQINQKPSLKKILGAAISITMLITGGYPAFTIALAYILAFYVLLKIILQFKNRQQNIWIISLSNISVIVLAILLSMILLVSVFNSLSDFSRLQSVDIHYSNDGALSLESFISLILPYSVVSAKNGTVFILNSYFTMANSYFGLLPLFLFLYTFFKRPSKKVLVLLSIGIIFLLFTLGENFLVFRFIFKTFPGFDLFRYPNFARLFFIIPFLLIAGINLDKILDNNKLKFIKISLLCFIILFLLITVYSFFQSQISLANLSIYDFAKNISLSQRILIQSIIQILFLISLFFFIRNQKKTCRIKMFLLLFLVLDMIISFQLNFLYSGYAPRITVREANTLIFNHKMPVTLEKNQNIYQNVSDGKIYLFQNGFNDFEGKVSSIGNTSFKTKLFERLSDQYPEQFKKLTSNPIVYFSNYIKPASFLYNSEEISTSVLFLDDSIYNQYKNISVKNNETKYKISNLIQNPSSIEFELYTTKPGFICLQQNYFKGWNVEVNGKKGKISKANLTFMSVFVENGKSKIRFYFENKLIRNLFYFSGISFLIAMAFFIYLTVIEYINA